MLRETFQTNCFVNVDEQLKRNIAENEHYDCEQKMFCLVWLACSFVTLPVKYIQAIRVYEKGDLCTLAYDWNTRNNWNVIVGWFLKFWLPFKYLQCSSIGFLSRRNEESIICKVASLPTNWKKMMNQMGGSISKPVFTFPVKTQFIAIPCNAL